MIYIVLLSIPVLLYLGTTGKFTHFKNEIVNTYQDWKSLNRLVASNPNTRFVYLESIKIVFNAKYLKFTQYLNNSSKKIDKKTYLVTYYIEGKQYKMLVKPKKGPNPILKILDENEIDITQEILPYMGPNLNWHNYPVTPDFFNKKNISFEYNNQNKLTFNYTDIIKT
jgi:hypothetical protein|uniref:Uncharacterized protein n=1 Tax=viral metagenome TaxID=1070528 RepID=A0A6C0J1T9_9ZZZZ